MSLAGHFSSRYVNQLKNRDKHGREIKTREDFRETVLRHSDGSSAKYRHGQEVAGSRVEAPEKKTANKDVRGGESKFYKQTEISTIVQKTRGETTTDTMGEKETAARVRKRIDVNAPRMRM